MQKAILKKKSLIQRILQAESPDEWAQELNWILQDEPKLKMPVKQLVQSATQYKLDLHRKFGKDLEKFYAEFLKACLSHKALTGDERETLQRLKALFGLSDRTAARIHNQVAEEIYRMNVKDALRDLRLSQKEQTLLRAVQEELNLPDVHATKIYQEQATELVKKSFLQALSDRRLSPVEEEELRTLARSLGAEIEYDEKTEAILNKYRLYWVIENADLPAIDTTLRLRTKERCFFATDVDWCQISTVVRSARYGTGKKQESEEAWEAERIDMIKHREAKPVDSGRLYLTSQRLLFRGLKLDRDIPLARITSFIPVEHGVYVERKSGKNPFLKLESGLDVFILMLARLLRDTH